MRKWMSKHDNGWSSVVLLQLLTLQNKMLQSSSFKIEIHICVILLTTTGHRVCCYFCIPFYMVYSFYFFHAANHGLCYRKTMCHDLPSSIMFAVPPSMSNVQQKIHTNDIFHKLSFETFFHRMRFVPTKVKHFFTRYFKNVYVISAQYLTFFANFNTMFDKGWQLLRSVLV